MTAAAPVVLRDPDIRAVLATHVLAPYIAAPGTLVRHELCVCDRRADIAAVNGEMHGWEIKSDQDSLVRLAGQVEAYGKVFDRATLVTTPRWVERVDAHIPAWWGLIVVDPDSATHLRAAGDNSARVDPMSLAQLLWRDEALDELRQRGQARGLSKKARRYVWERLVETVPLEELRAMVRARLRARTCWSGGSGALQGVEA